MRVPAWLWLRLRRPFGVRIVHGNGTVSKCRLRFVKTQAGGKVLWTATPPPGVRFDPFLGDHLEFAILPPRVEVMIEMHHQRNENFP